MKMKNHFQNFLKYETKRQYYNRSFFLDTAQAFIFKKERDEELQRITNIIKKRNERDKNLNKIYQN